MVDAVSSENSKNSNINTTELQRLELLIKKSDADLKELGVQLESLEKEIRQKENEIKIAKENYNALEPKILTRKQLKDLNLKRERAKEEKLKELKNNIDIITKSEFEKAKLIRSEAEDNLGDEKQSLLTKALQTEINALEKEVEVKSSILRENQAKAQDILAERVLEELKISKLRKDINKFKDSKKENNFSSSFKERISAMTSRKNGLLYEYEKITEGIDDISLKIKKSKKLLKNKIAELESLS